MSDDRGIADGHLSECEAKARLLERELAWQQAETVRLRAVLRRIAALNMWTDGEQAIAIARTALDTATRPPAPGSHA